MKYGKQNSHRQRVWLIGIFTGALMTTGHVVAGGMPPGQTNGDVKAPAPAEVWDKTPKTQSLPTGHDQTPQLPKASLPAGTPTQAFSMDWNSVYFDTAADGTIWASSGPYKASFSAEGFTYVPFMGSDAPKNYPVALAVQSVGVGGHVVPAQVNGLIAPDGRRITIDHGGFIEQYDLTPQSIEQSFVFTTLPGGGDLTLRLSVFSELAVIEDGGGGVRMTNERGGVTYTQAAAVDAAGRRLPIAVRSHHGETASDGVLELSVPATFLANATFPLTIDPVIATGLSVDATGSSRLADVAYDLTTARYAVVYEYNFGATDGDIYIQLRTAAGALVAGSEVPIDNGNLNWRNPSVANNRLASQFLAVAEFGAAPSRIIMGRTREAASNFTGAQFTISAGEAGDLIGPRVGGDPSSFSPTYYCVTWERILSATDHDIFARLVLTNSTLLTPASIQVDNSGSTIDTNPSISKSDGDGASSTTQNWSIVWQRTFNATDEDIRGAQIHWDGGINIASWSIDASGDNDERPAVSSFTDISTGARNYLVVFQEGPASGPRHLWAYVLNGTSYVDGNILTNLEAINTGLDHVFPSTDCDETKFVVTYTEFYNSSTDYDVYASEFCLNAGNILRVGESHRNLDFALTVDSPPRLTAAHSGGATSRDFMGAWAESPAFGGTGPIIAGLYRTTVHCCYGDVDDNGTVGIDDLVAVITNWNNFCLGCPQDINGSTFVGIDDLVAVITRWGPCPSP